ncbi:hypothetical protein INR49_014451 [Caranx melampygus]|nr:hypothetical protein INR49_014451 [Caranx melampygus]
MNYDTQRAKTHLRHSYDPLVAVGNVVFGVTLRVRKYLPGGKSKNKCKRGEEELTDSTVAGESEEGEGGNEIGESGSEIWLLEQVCCGEEEKGREPPKGLEHGDEGGSEEPYIIAALAIGQSVLDSADLPQ